LPSPPGCFMPNRLRQWLIITSFALLGWVLCAATMGIGMAAASLDTALIFHTVATPVFFATISTIYFNRYAYTCPLMTAVSFLVIVVLMDVFVVAMLIQRSFEMFSSFLGTWLPFVLIFGSTYLTGVIVRSGAGRART